MQHSAFYRLLLHIHKAPIAKKLSNLSMQLVAKKNALSVVVEVFELKKNDSLIIMDADNLLGHDFAVDVAMPVGRKADAKKHRNLPKAKGGQRQSTSSFVIWIPLQPNFFCPTPHKRMANQMPLGESDQEKWFRVAVEVFVLRKNDILVSVDVDNLLATRQMLCCPCSASSYTL